MSGLMADVIAIHAYQASKPYLCPGCRQGIAAGTAHVVVVPQTEPDLRRHWHRACWDQRLRRPPHRP